MERSTLRRGMSSDSDEKIAKGFASSVDHFKGNQQSNMKKEQCIFRGECPQIQMKKDSKRVCILSKGNQQSNMKKERYIFSLVYISDFWPQEH